MFRYLHWKHCISILCHLYQDHRNKLQKIHLFALLKNQSSGWTLFELFPIQMWLMIVVYVVRILSAYVWYPDENLTLSDTYFLYNFGRNLEIMISRSSLREQFLNPTNSSCSRSPLILSVPLLVLQDIRSFRRKKRHQRCVSGYHVPTFKKTNYSKNTVLIIKDFKKSKHLAK